MNICQLPEAQPASLPESCDVFLLTEDMVSLPERVNQ